VTQPAPVFPKLGDRSPDVVALQKSLLASGITVRGGADGAFGPATAAAVRAYQESVGLAGTGVVDEPTMSKLTAATPAPSPAPSPAPTPTPTPTTVLLRKGANGTKVADLQRLLIKAGITLRGGADGVYGSYTAAAVSAFQAQSNLPQTGEVDDVTMAALQAAADAVKVTLPGAIQVFPVAGKCGFVDSWMAPRSGGRRHEGVDIISPRGTPVVAAVDGTITRQGFDSPGSLGGNTLRLTAAGPTGTYYFMGHFESFAEGIKVGAEVKAGDVIAYVGSTGNTSVPHLHFEVHPNGGPAVNPYPVVKAVSTC
jgi:murein DD-endopeptidase MepM/ murein hydrolase activator NlpD